MIYINYVYVNKLFSAFILTQKKLKNLFYSKLISIFAPEYDAAKEAQAHLEDKINKMKVAIAEAKIVDLSRLSTDAVQIMSKVEMTNMGTKAKMVYTIVSESEANLKQGKISIKTPIAQGLLNHKEGEIVEVKIPRGTIKLRIDKISIDV